MNNEFIFIANIAGIRILHTLIFIAIKIYSPQIIDRQSATSRTPFSRPETPAYYHKLLYLGLYHHMKTLLLILLIK